MLRGVDFLVRRDVVVIVRQVPPKREGADTLPPSLYLVVALLEQPEAVQRHVVYEALRGPVVQVLAWTIVLRLPDLAQILEHRERGKEQSSLLHRPEDILRLLHVLDGVPQRDRVEE